MQTSIDENTPRFMERMIVSTTTKQPSPSKDSAQASEPVPKQAQETTPNKLDIALSYLEELELDDATFKILDKLAAIILTLYHSSAQYSLGAGYRCVEGEKIEPEIMKNLILAVNYSRV